MAVNLTKGGNISLSKDPDLKEVLIGLEWDERTTDGAAYDLDASIFMTNNGRVPSDEHFIFYKNLVSPCGSVTHTGDNRTGADEDGQDFDEAIIVKLPTIKDNVDNITVAVTIHDAEKLNQNFGQVRNPKITLVNNETKEEICTYHLDDEFSLETAVIFGQVYRSPSDPTEWKFKAVGSGFSGGLAALCSDHGINVE